MLRFLLHRPIAVTMSFLALLIMGAIALQVLPVSLLPNIPIPKIAVQISLPNVASRELENTVTKVLRNQLLQVSNLKDISSQTRNGSAMIQLEFEFGTNTDLAFIEVNEKIDQSMGGLPRELERPRILKDNISDIPIFNLSIYPKDAKEHTLLELSEFTNSIIQRRIEQLPQVAFVDRSGFAQPIIQIIPNQVQLQSLKLQESDFVDILNNNNLELGSILVKDGQYQYNIRFLSALRSVEDIEQIYFKHQGRVLRLKEVATIQLREAQARGQYFYNSQQAIVLAIRKQAESQLFDLKREFQHLLESFREDYPSLNFAISNDQSKLLAVSINNLQSSLLYGAVFAFFILFAFFREWKLPIIIGVTIPTALVLSILGFFAFGISINIISLSGLILGVGLMIDNAIIILDNIQQHQNRKSSMLNACVKGTNEVIRPLISSALTTCSVFLPLIFLSGIAGALFYDQAVAICIALAASLLVAYFLLPTLLTLLSNDQAATKKKAPAKKTVYEYSVEVALKHKYLVVLIFLCFAVYGFLNFERLEKKMFPNLSRAALKISVDWEESISLEENRWRNQELLDFMKEFGSFDSQLFVGQEQFLLHPNVQSINESQLIVYDNNISEEIEASIHQYLEHRFPNSSYSIQPLENIFDQIFGSDQVNFIVHIQALQKNTTPKPTDVQFLFNYLDSLGLRYTRPPQVVQSTISILKEKALRYDVPYLYIYDRLKSLLNQNQIGILRTNQEFIPIQLGNESSNFELILKNATVFNRKQQAIPLREFVEMNKQVDYKFLSAGKTGETLNIPLMDVEQGLISEIIRYLKKVIGFNTYFTGSFFDDQVVIKELGFILCIVLCLLYLILSIQFESLTLPIIVLFSIPIGIAGSFFLLQLMGESINLVSLVGIIVMCGIVVNDAILKVDMMQKHRSTHTIKQAIHIAGDRRLRPIIMTSLTTILALFPILFSSGLGAELQSPLAYSIIGGLFSGTIGSLYFIPIIYFLLTKNKTK